MCSELIRPFGKHTSIYTSAKSLDSRLAVSLPFKIRATHVALQTRSNTNHANDTHLETDNVLDGKTLQQNAFSAI